MDVIPELDETLPLATNEAMFEANRFLTFVSSQTEHTFYDITSS